MTQKLTIDEICQKLKVADLSGFSKPGRNKGERGQQLELALGVANSSALTDLEDGEIKSFTFGESIAVTQLKHCLHEIITHKAPFHDSKVGAKIRNTLYIAFDRNGSFRSWKCAREYHGFLSKLAEDYEYIVGAVTSAYTNSKKLHTITGPNEALQIRTKASKTKNGTYVPMTYQETELSNKGMAFYLTAKFAKSVF